MKPEPEHGTLSALAAQVEHYRTVFRWPERRSSLLLPLLFVISVAVHGLAFYIFQVQYPPTAVSAPPPAQVTLLTGDTPQGAALLKWVESRDPATAARVMSAGAPALKEILYTPSYAAAQTQPLDQDPPVDPVPMPPAHSLLDWTCERPRTATPGAPKRVASSLKFSESLRKRDATPGTPLALTSRSTVNLHRAVFLAAVSGEGQVRYCFLQERSGDPAMDSQAEALLRAHAFLPSGTALEWGYAVITWGAEAYAPEPTPTPMEASGT
ncbi:MAG: hypothetical protein ACFUZC_18230 [Chthoniobacteraceae bacterium]